MDGSASALRAFFRYAEIRNWTASRISQSIQGPRLFAHENLPVGPSWEDVNRLFDSLQSQKRSDIRDRAIMMLFAIYGLRSGEVATLRLEDIDWENNQIKITRQKQRRSQVYPLIGVVGNALIKYLRSVRPQCFHREVFLTLKAPIKPLSISGLTYLVGKRMRKLDIRSVRRGPHALRHACATHLLLEGLSLKEIGDHLGHRSSSATRIYAKVDLESLREVAAYNFGGAL
jgi:site-specific recombinase XerD